VFGLLKIKQRGNYVRKLNDSGVSRLYNGLVVFRIKNEYRGVLQSLAGGKGDNTLPVSSFEGIYRIEGLENKKIQDLYPNACCVLMTEDSNTCSLAIYKKKDGILRYVPKPKKEHQKKGAIHPLNNEQAFYDALLRDPEVLVVGCIGDAGSGKTLLALNAGYRLLKDRDPIKWIKTFRPYVPAGPDMGFIPGDLIEKMDPYAGPIKENLFKVMLGEVGNFSEAKETMSCMFGKKMTLSIESLTHIQGRTFNNTFAFLDEAENASPEEMKRLISRMGSGSKVVCSGDVNQVATRGLSSKHNGLSHLIDCLKGEEGFACIELIEVERGPIAKLAKKL